MIVIRRRLSTLGVVALALVVSVSAPRARAAESLPTETITAASLSMDQAAKIDQYIAAAVADLKQAKESAVTPARHVLLEPLGLGPSDAFLRYYRQHVATALTPLLAHKDLLVRLNAMIVLDRVGGADAVPIAGKALADASPAVRYWAAKTIADQAAALPGDAQKQVLATITKRVASEHVPQVVEQLLVTMGSLTLPEAKLQLLEALNQRVAYHAQHPGTSIGPEEAGLQRLYKTLFGAAAKPDPNVLKALGRTALRYLDLTATQLDLKQVPDDAVRQTYHHTVQLTYYILRFVQGATKGAPAAPPDLTDAIKAGNWKMVRVQVEAWRNVLEAPPFGFSAKELEIPKATTTARGS